MGTESLLPYQQRVVDERIELDTKRRLLDIFISTGAFHNLESVEQDLLKQQSTRMTQYSDILARRIGLFPARATT